MEGVGLEVKYLKRYLHISSGANTRRREKKIDELFLMAKQQPRLIFPMVVHSIPSANIPKMPAKPDHLFDKR